MLRNTINLLFIKKNKGYNKKTQNNYKLFNF